MNDHQFANIFLSFSFWWIRNLLGETNYKVSRTRRHTFKRTKQKKAWRWPKILREMSLFLHSKRFKLEGWSKWGFNTNFRFNVISHIRGRSMDVREKSIIPFLPKEINHGCQRNMMTPGRSSSRNKSQLSNRRTKCSRERTSKKEVVKCIIILFHDLDYKEGNFRQ